jgi:hypothetical protein
MVKTLQYFLQTIMVLGVVFACAPANTPDATARAFWEAMAAGDDTAVRDHATGAGSRAMDSSQGRWRGVAATFGEIRINGDVATVDTRLTFPDRTGQAPIRLRTVLRRENGRWRVDYTKTMESLPAQHALSDLIKELRRFSEQFSGELDRGSSELEKDLPEIEKALKNLGDSVGEALERTIPQLQKGIEAFLQSLQRALDEAKKKRDADKRRDRKGETTI